MEDYVEVAKVRKEARKAVGAIIDVEMHDLLRIGENDALKFAGTPKGEQVRCVQNEVVELSGRREVAHAHYAQAGQVDVESIVAEVVDLELLELRAIVYVQVEVVKALVAEVHVQAAQSAQDRPIHFDLEEVEISHVRRHASVDRYVGQKVQTCVGQVDLSADRQTSDPEQVALHGEPPLDADRPAD